MKTISTPFFSDCVKSDSPTIFTSVGRGFVGAFCLMLYFSPQTVVAKKPLDLLIRGGTIVDGTGNAWFKGGVGIRGDQIAQVARPIDVPPKRKIDATNLVVAPGFSDIHSPSDYLLLEDGNA